MLIDFGLLLGFVHVGRAAANDPAGNVLAPCSVDTPEAAPDLDDFDPRAAFTGDVDLDKIQEMGPSHLQSRM